MTEPKVTLSAERVADLAQRLEFIANNPHVIAEEVEEACDKAADALRSLQAGLAAAETSMAQKRGLIVDMTTALENRNRELHERDARIAWLEKDATDREALIKNQAEEIVRLLPYRIGGTLKLAARTLREWAERYGEWSVQMPSLMQDRLPPGTHLQALEGLEELDTAIAGKGEV